MLSFPTPSLLIANPLSTSFSFPTPSPVPISLFQLSDTREKTGKFSFVTQGYPHWMCSPMYERDVTPKVKFCQVNFKTWCHHTSEHTYFLTVFTWRLDEHPCMPMPPSTEYLTVRDSIGSFEFNMAQLTHTTKLLTNHKPKGQWVCCGQ